MMRGKSLHNKSYDGLNIFLRAVMVAGEFIALSFLFSLVNILGNKHLAILGLTLITVTIVVLYLERALQVDEKIKSKNQTSPRWSIFRFARLTMLIAGFLVILKSMSALFR